MSIALHDLNVVELFTDGACLGNPGPGGWGVILRWRGVEKELSGGTPLTTNNRMELTAAIEGLSALRRPCSVRIYSDSTYVRDGITRWINLWRRNGWRTADRRPIKNIDLWQKLTETMVGHEVEWHWVRGHSGHAENERADQLARSSARRQRAELVRAEAVPSSLVFDS
ncbi:MAG: ribonuclease HI [Rhodospirillales bacterium]